MPESILVFNHNSDNSEINAEKKAESRHTSVLLEETLAFFSPQEGGRYIDGTLGMGGHAEALLEKARGAGLKDFILLGLDRDTEALALAGKRLEPFGKQIITRHACFSSLATVLDELGWDAVDGLLVDIGVSSMQIDEADRGFSFLSDGPLDMRMDRSWGRSAEWFVNKGQVAQLKDIIARYGEDPMAGRIARAIDDARAQKSITTTKQLADIVEKAYPAKWRAKARNHPATRTFQALRMAVNDELGELERFLHSAVARLAPGGRVAVISFHSLEDRIVKHFFREQATGCTCPRHIPMCICGKTPTLKVLTRKPVEPTDEEIRNNSRSSSAKLRVAEKLP